jgi:hypothetical protein
VALMQEQQAEKDSSVHGSFYGAGGNSPTLSRARPGHETLMGPYHTSSTSGHRPSHSVDTSSSNYVTPSSPNSSTEDLMDGFQPSFWGWNGVLLHPRRSLRIVNRDEAPVRRDSERSTG